MLYIIAVLYLEGQQAHLFIVDKYPSLISFRGKYYYRSGSTMREITGKELERTLLNKDKAVKRGRLTFYKAPEK